MKLRKNSMKVLRAGWYWLRQVSGDAAYDNYLLCNNRCTDTEESLAPAPPLSRAEFYLDSLRRRYSTVSRCC
jgi:putative selenoprotein